MKIQTVQGNIMVQKDVEAIMKFGRIGEQSYESKNGNQYAIVSDDA